MQGYFIDHLGKEALESFVYKGEDKSLIYKYVLSPLAEFLVNRCTPRHIAPNTITALAMAIMTASFINIWYWLPVLVTRQDETIEAPLWIFFAHGVAMLVYQTMDNMDGKQARRTRSSSPLGLLFDHGCDAINTPMSCISWIATMGLISQGGWRNDAVIGGAFFSAIFPFYLGTWEEYYTGALVLPVFNGPSEGLLLGAATFILTSVKGTDWWQTTSVVDFLLFGENMHSVTNCEALLIISVLVALREVFVRIFAICKGYGIYCLINLLPLVILFSCAMKVISKHDFFHQNSRLYLNLVGVLFLEAVTALMLDHMTHTKFCAFRLILVPLVIFSLIIDGVDNDTLHSFLLIYTVGVSTFVVFKMRIIVHEICAALSINCFKIKSDFTSKND